MISYRSKGQIIFFEYIFPDLETTQTDDAYILEILADQQRFDYGFNLLVRKYQERLYWHIRRMVVDHDDADDLVQEAFIKVYKNIDKFKGDSQLYTWLYRIATNVCLTFLEKKRRRFFLPIGDVRNELANKVDDNVISGDQIQIKLQKAIVRLPEKQRLVFNMKYFDKMKYEDIAEITGSSVGTLKANYHHAVKKIEEFLSGD